LSHDENTGLVFMNHPVALYKYSAEATRAACRSVQWIALLFLQQNLMARLQEEN
jgi:hypothetical protein